MEHLEQKQKEEKAKEEATLNVDKNESENGYTQEQYIELQNIESSLAQVQCGLKVADESFSEGNAELKALLLKRIVPGKNYKKHKIR